jgi:hypothetical protein
LIASEAQAGGAPRVRSAELEFVVLEELLAIRARNAERCHAQILEPGAVLREIEVGVGTVSSPLQLRGAS